MLSKYLDISITQNKYPNLSVREFFKKMELLSDFKAISNNLKYKAALMADALMLFNDRINHLEGKKMNKLFNIDNVTVKNSEIYIGSKKGIKCSLESSPSQTWPLGDFIVNNLINVSRIYF